MAGLLSCLGGRQLSAIKSAAEPPVGTLRDRPIRFGMSCKAENGELANTEMPLYPDDFEPVRLEISGATCLPDRIRGKNKTFIVEAEGEGAAASSSFNRFGQD